MASNEWLRPLTPDESASTCWRQPTPSENDSSRCPICCALKLVVGDVVGIDPDRKRVDIATDTGPRVEPYGTLVYAVGSVASIGGLPDHRPPLTGPIPDTQPRGGISSRKARFQFGLHHKSQGLSDLTREQDRGLSAPRKPIRDDRGALAGGILDRHGGPVLTAHVVGV